ncbi:MAG: YkgJ family cysteine cluster protein [Bacillota bacterium]
MNKFQCDACGICCTKLDKSKIYQELDRGDGTCIYFDEKSRLCNIYENRPLICRVDEMYEKYFKNKFTRKEYNCLNQRNCFKWQKEEKWKEGKNE